MRRRRTGGARDAGRVLVVAGARAQDQAARDGRVELQHDRAGQQRIVHQQCVALRDEAPVLLALEARRRPPHKVAAPVLQRGHVLRGLDLLAAPPAPAPSEAPQAAWGRRGHAGAQRARLSSWKRYMKRTTPASRSRREMDMRSSMGMNAVQWPR